MKCRPRKFWFDVMDVPCWFYEVCGSLLKNNYSGNKEYVGGGKRAGGRPKGNINSK